MALAAALAALLTSSKLHSPRVNFSAISTAVRLRSSVSKSQTLRPSTNGVSRTILQLIPISFIWPISALPKSQIIQSDRSKSSQIFFRDRPSTHAIPSEQALWDLNQALNCFAVILPPLLELILRLLRTLPHH